MKYDWVTQEGKIEERVLRNEIKNIVENQKLSNAQKVAFYTDEIVIDLFWKNGREEELNREMEKNFLSQERLRLLLELRIFNEAKELKIWRSVIGETFFFRIADDKKINEENQFKVENYLDIDEKVGKLEENKHTFPGYRPALETCCLQKPPGGRNTHAAEYAARHPVFKSTPGRKEVQLQR